MAGVKTLLAVREIDLVRCFFDELVTYVAGYSDDPHPRVDSRAPSPLQFSTDGVLTGPQGRGGALADDDHRRNLRRVQFGKIATLDDPCAECLEVVRRRDS